MNDILKYYEDISLKYKVIHKLKRDGLILIALMTLGIFIMESVFKEINNVILGGLEILLASIVIYIFLSRYIKYANIVINANKDKTEMKKLKQLKMKNIDIESKNFFKAVNCYEINMIKKYLQKNKMMKKNKILFMIETLKDKRNKTNIIMNMQLIFIVPLSISIGTNYLAKLNIEDAGAFIIYCLLYVGIIVLIINVITLLIISICEIIRFPIRDKQTFKILEDILSDIYLNMKD